MNASVKIQILSTLVVKLSYLDPDLFSVIIYSRCWSCHDKMPLGKLLEGSAAKRDLFRKMRRREITSIHFHLNFFISIKEFKKSNKNLSALLILISSKRLSRVECDQFIFVIFENYNRIITKIGREKSAYRVESTGLSF